MTHRGETQAERVLRLEVQMEDLHKKIDLIETKVEAIDDKLDELLILRHKGAGALWILSGIAFVVITTLAAAFSGVFHK